MYARRSSNGRPPASASQGTSPPRSGPIRIQGPAKTRPTASAARSLPVFRQMHFPDPGSVADDDIGEGLYATDPNSPEGLSMAWAGEEVSRARGMTAQPQRSQPAVDGPRPPVLLLDSLGHLLLSATTYSPPKTPHLSPEAGACGSSYRSLTPPSSSDIPGLTRDEGENESDASGSHYSPSPDKDKPLPPVPVHRLMPECHWRCGSRLTADEVSRGACDKCNRQLGEESLQRSLLLLKPETASSMRPTAWIQQKLAHARASKIGHQDSERRRRPREADHHYRHNGNPNTSHTYQTPTSHDRRGREPTACRDTKARKSQSPQIKRTDIEASRYVAPVSNFLLRPARSGNLAGRRQMNGKSSNTGPGAMPPASPTPKRSPRVFTHFSAKPGENGPPLYPKPLAVRRPGPDRQSPQASGNSLGYGRGATPRSCSVESASATDVMFVVSPNGTMQDQPERDGSMVWSQQLHLGGSTSGSERSRGPAFPWSSTDDLVDAYLGLPDRNGARQWQGGGETALHVASRGTTKPSTARVERPAARRPPKSDQPRSASSQAAKIAPREPWPGMPGPWTLGTAGQFHPERALKAGRPPPTVPEPERSRPVRAQSPAKSLPPIKFDTSRRRPACDRL